MASRLTKAALVHSLRDDGDSVNEQTLLKDIPYILQAISAGPIVFPSYKVQDSSTSLKKALPTPLLHLVSILIESGLLYRKIATFASPETRADGLIRQALKATFMEELTGYLNKIAVIEGQIRQQESQEDAQGGTANQRVTLKRVILWTRDDLLRLRLMDTIITNIGQNEGGAIINIIHDLSRHGDPMIQAFTQKTLQEISRPFYEMLARWIYEGELVDPYHEFLVRPAAMTMAGQRSERPGSSDASENAWKGKYVLTKIMVPRWMSDKLAQKVYLIGKSLNFIRHTCADADFVMQHSKKNAEVLEYGDTSALERSIDEAYSVTSQHLKSLMLDNFHLLDHLGALKRYMLLNAGDFVSVLMERLGDTLDHPASTLHRHNLTSSLGDAIQTSNAQYEPEHVITHLDARMQEDKKSTVGWEAFTLEYRVGKPIDVILTDSNARKYLKIFHELWRLKRVEFALGTSWRRYMTGERGMLHHVKIVSKDWRTVRGVNDAMMHFICQLQYYILYEVIEDSWAVLQKEISNSVCDLDTIIHAHDKYVSTIVEKALLNKDCSSILHEILKIMLAYRDQTRQLYSYSLSEYTASQSISSRTNIDTTSDDTSTNDVSPAPNQSLQAIRDRLQTLASDFREATRLLLAALAYQQSETMRFLAVRLNYNEFYEIPRPGKQKERPTEAVNANPDTVAVGA